MLCLVLSSCASTMPVWRNQIMEALYQLGKQGVPKEFPQEYGVLLETFEHGEALYHVQKDTEQADAEYQRALQKYELLKQTIKSAREQQAEDARKLEAERIARAEEGRLMREAAEAELRLLEQERRQAEEMPNTSNRQPLTTKEPTIHLPSSYTVKRGETLPQIAARAEIYNDASLWPIIYRANRDQIRDPKRLWPGQVLFVPRHFSKDDALGARRYSGKK